MMKIREKYSLKFVPKSSIWRPVVIEKMMQLLMFAKVSEVSDGRLVHREQNLRDVIASHYPKMNARRRFSQHDDAEVAILKDSLLGLQYQHGLFFTSARATTFVLPSTLSNSGRRPSRRP
jgi:hypothetical protein